VLFRSFIVVIVLVHEEELGWKGVTEVISEGQFGCKVVMISYSDARKKYALLCMVEYTN